MIIYSADKSNLMEIEKFSREGSSLKFQGKIMGSMPVTAIVTPNQVRNMLKGLGFKLLIFAFSMVFRSEPRKN